MFLSEACSQVIAKMELTARVIWGALTASMLLYVVVAFAVAANLEAPTGSGGILGALAVLAGVEVVVAEYWRRSRFSGDPALRAALTACGSRSVPDAPGLASDEQWVVAGLRVRLTHFVVLMGLHAGVALLGLVAALLDGRPESILPFVGVAIVLNLVVFPKWQRDAVRMLEFIQSGLTA